MSAALQPAEVGPAEGVQDVPTPSPELGRIARLLYAERRARDAAIPCDLLHEGAWDLLLDLYACIAAGEKVCTTSACAAACIPATTAQRLVTNLEKSGMIRRVRPPEDQRVRHLLLTAQAEGMMTRFLEGLVEDALRK